MRTRILEDGALGDSAPLNGTCMTITTLAADVGRFTNRIHDMAEG